MTRASEPLPAIGFGTYTLTDRNECLDAITTALETGYRLVDTAQVYDNEALVGDAIAASSVPREEVTIATKLHWERLGYEETLRSAHESRDRLDVDSIDLLYVHWPIDSYDPAETLPALDELVDRGLVDRVGFCNCSPDLLAEAQAGLDAPIAAHQVESHPLFPQSTLLADARERSAEFVAAVPLGKGAALDLSGVRSVALERDLTPAQVVLAWQIRRGATPIPKARGTHVVENYAAVDIAPQLDGDDVARIEETDERRRIVDGWPEAHWKRG